MSKESKAQIDELRMIVTSHLEGKETAIDVGCASLVEDDLAVRVFPDVFAQQDEDGLIPLDQLTPIGLGAFKIGDLVLFAHPFFRRSLSRLNSLNKPFLKQLQSLATEGIDVKTALDNDMVGLASTYRTTIECEYWWGPRFDDEEAAIPAGVTKHVANNDVDRLFHGMAATEFRWQSRDGEHIFEAEELRDVPSAPLEAAQYGCRYVHSIVQESTGQVYHLDGAVRLYSEEKMIERLDTSLAHAARDTQYSKLWRIDEHLPISVWKGLLSDYFRDNYLVGEYLGATREERCLSLTGLVCTRRSRLCVPPVIALCVPLVAG